MPVALITGGASLICEGMTKCLVSRGWHVVVSDIDLAGAEHVASVAQGPGTAQACLLDATRGADAKALVARILAEHGAIDGLVNAAGGARGIGFKKMPFVEMTPDYWTRLLDANLGSVLTVTHAVLPAMIAARRGAIVSVAAGRGLKGGAQASIYSAAKAAIVVFSQAIAQEVGPAGVRVNTIAPGNAEARWKKQQLEEARSPLGRPTNADDVGKAVAFLLSDEASHITGACLDISGGTSLH
jgi:NAD(P)-dependent dehydrogenase (short-subunit alcohol dehydrogenase family)